MRRIVRWARHVRQSQLSTGAGLFPNQALTRTTSTAISNASRNTACPRSRIRPPGKSCDEYPFASTLEGAAHLPHAGRTFPGCGLDARLPIGQPGQGPGWSACMINERHNESGGFALGALYRTQRMLDGDRFFIHVANV